MTRALPDVLSLNLNNHTSTERYVGLKLFERVGRCGIVQEYGEIHALSGSIAVSDIADCVLFTSAITMCTYMSFFTLTFCGMVIHRRRGERRG